MLIVTTLGFPLGYYNLLAKSVSSPIYPSSIHRAVIIIYVKGKSDHGVVPHSLK